MSRLAIILPLFSVSAFFSGCRKESKLIGEAVKVSGYIDQNSTGASKVLAVSRKSGRRLEKITDNRFTVKIDDAQPWVLIFLNSSDQKVGYLSLGEGIETLPMYYASAGTKSLDLGNLTKNGQFFLPELNPLQGDIPFSGAERSAVGLSDDWFSASAITLDADENGTPDFTEGKRYQMSVLYFISGGEFVQGLSPVLDSSGFVNGFKLFVFIKEDDPPQSVYVTGPEGSGLQNAHTTERYDYGDYVHFFSPMVQSQFPPGGVYTVSYGSKNLKFSIPDQSYILNNIVIPWPTVGLNADGTINNVSWQMKLPYGSNVVINPASLISSIQLQIDGIGSGCQSNLQPFRLYNSPNLSPETTVHTLECQNIPWNAVQQIYVAYEDQFGQNYVVFFKR